MYVSSHSHARRLVLLAGLAASLVITASCSSGSTSPSAGTAPSTGVTTGTPRAAEPSSASPSAGGQESSAATTSPSSAESSNPQALDQLEKQVTTDSGLDSTSSEADYSSYERVTHSGGKFSFEVPTDWTQENISDNEPIIQRAPDLDKFLTNFSTGIEAQRFTDQSAEQMLAKTEPGCGGKSPVRPYDDGRFKGIMQTFSQCSGDGNAVVVSVVSTADDGAFRAYFNSSYIDTRDVAALKRIISSVTYQ